MELKPIAELADVITGFPFDGARYGSEGIRVVRGENVTIGALRWDTTKCWKDEFEHVEYYSLKAGDVVVGMDGSRVGHNRARVEESDLPLLLAQRVACLRAKPGVDPAYLYYLFKSDRFPEYVERIQTGSTVPHISKDQIEAFMVPCPDKKTQQSVGSVLSALDAKIALNQRINAELEGLAKLLYDYWFVQFDFPMSAAQARRLGKPQLEGKPYKSSGGPMVHNAALKREVPEGWEVELLDAFGDFRNGINYDPKEEGDTDARIINVRNISSSTLFVNNNDLDRIRLRGSAVDKYKVTDRTILIARSGIPGGWSEEPNTSRGG